MLLSAISGTSAKPRDEWTTDISFNFDGTRQTPPELIPVLKQNADTIVRSLAVRA
jgi:hypothetical protein